MVTLCWETHSSSYGSFLLIHKVLLTQNHERTGVKQQIFRAEWVLRASSQTPSFYTGLRGQLKSWVRLWALQHHSVLWGIICYCLLPASFQSLVCGDVFISLAAYLVHPSLFSVTYIDNKCFNLCFRQKLAYLEESEQWTAFFQIN